MNEPTVLETCGPMTWDVQRFAHGGSVTIAETNDRRRDSSGTCWHGIVLSAVAADALARFLAPEHVEVRSCAECPSVQEFREETTPLPESAIEILGGARPRGGPFAAARDAILRATDSFLLLRGVALLRALAAVAREGASVTPETRAAFDAEVARFAREYADYQRVLAECGAPTTNDSAGR